MTGEREAYSVYHIPCTSELLRSDTARFFLLATSWTASSVCVHVRDSTFTCMCVRVENAFFVCVATCHITQYFYLSVAIPLFLASDKKIQFM